MTESTARAERFDLQTAAGPCFSWEVPQKPVSVRIPLALIDRLENEAVENFRSLSSRGSEIGGVLLGSNSPGTPMIVTLDEYELIACDYSRGPLYRLSDADMGRFERAIEQKRARVVGFFRSHTRKGLSLDPEDLGFFQLKFRDPHQVALLIRPFASKASTAGIFIWEDGQVKGDASPLEFQFRSSQLSGGKAAETAPAKPEAPVNTASSALLAPRTATRAQIVPIASRREISLPGPLGGAVAPEALPEPAEVAAPVKAPEPPPAPVAKSAPPPAPAPAPAAKAAPAPPPKPATAPAPAAPIAKTAPAPPALAPKPASGSVPALKSAPVPERKIEKAPEEKPVIKTPAAAKPALPPLPAAAAPSTAKERDLETNAAVAPPRSTKVVKLIGAAAASILLFVLLFVYPGFMRHSSKTRVVPQDTSPLQLRVERTATGLLLTWNQDADTIRSASRAVLSITDGDQHEDVKMDLEQLKTGSIMYTPSTSDVGFRMEVTGTDPSKITTASFRALNSRPSPLVDQSQTGPNAAKPANNVVPATPTTPVNGKPVVEAPVEQPIVEQVKPTSAGAPLKPFNTDSLSLSTRLRPTRPTDLDSAPTVGVAGVATGSVPGLNLNSVSAPSAPAPPPPVQPAPVQQAPTPQKAALVSGGNLKQAVLSYRKEPEYPKLAKQAGAKGEVILAATIGTNGRLKNIKVVKGHPMLVKAATDAVSQWVYNPTILNGQAVEAQTEIKLNFVGDR
jgi:protein TonB